MYNVEVRETGEREFMEKKFAVYSLFLNSIELCNDADHLQVLQEIPGREGGVVVVYYIKRAVDICVLSLYGQAGHRPIEQRKGCGVQYIHDLYVARVNKGGKVLKENLKHFNDSGYQPEEWALDTQEMVGAGLVVTFANRYQPERSFSETFDLSKFVAVAL